MTKTQCAFIFAAMTLVLAGVSTAWNGLMSKFGYDDATTEVQTHSWAIGEFRDCKSLRRPTSLVLVCGDTVAELKTLRVRYYGTIKYSGKLQSPDERHWRCRKNAETDLAITCYRSPT
jgi:hypothetical protein